MASEENDSGPLLAEPPLGTWRIANSVDEHAGALVAESDQVVLKLFINGAIWRGEEWHHPTLEALKPGSQPTCVGYTRRARTVTLTRCALSRWQVLHGRADGDALLEATIWVGQVRIGADRIEPTDHCVELSFEAAGLHNILANARVKHEFLSAIAPGNEKGRKLREATQADDAYLVYQSRPPKVEVNYRDKRYEISFSTSVSESHSSHVGVHIGSKDIIHITTSSASIEELLAVKFQIEQLLSLLCIGHFAGRDVTVHRSDTDLGIKLLWRLGDEANKEIVERMQHQVLATLGQNPDLTERAVKRWFDATEERSIARWLVYDTLSERTFSNPRFLAVAQAWELVGREVCSNMNHDKTHFAKACDEAAQVLEKYLGKSTADRLKGMLKSNNRPSFRTLVEQYLQLAPSYAVSQLCGDLNKFAGLVAKTRNILTHLNTDREDRFDLDWASHISLYLTYKMTVLFCIIEAQWLGLPLDNLGTMLANSPMARGAQRPLPER